MIGNANKRQILVDLLLGLRSSVSLKDEGVRFEIPEVWLLGVSLPLVRAAL